MDLRELDIDELGEYQMQRLRPTLLFVLDMACTHLMTEPRDAVYGLLNLLPSGHDIIPNYQLPVRDVYMDWAVRAMDEDGSFNSLAQVGYLDMNRSNGYRKDFDLSSWVPDVSNVAGPLSITHQQYVAQRSDEEEVASPNKYSNRNRPFTIEVTDSRALTVYVLLWTTIRFVAELPYLRYHTNGQFDALLAFCFLFPGGC
jgi:hypothetical protein